MYLKLTQLIKVDNLIPVKQNTIKICYKKEINNF